MRKVELKIHGMHCASCEVLIERQFKRIAGVEKVSVRHTDGRAKLYCSRQPDLNELQAAVQEHGYTVSVWVNRHHTSPPTMEANTRKNYVELGAVFLVLLALYLLLRKFGIVPKLGIAENMSYVFVFLLGLVAAMSTCLAVTGGLLVALAAKYSEQHPSLTGWQKFKPHVFFNIGRVVSYTVLGGLIGALGSVITLSPRVNGLVTIVASLVMVTLGLKLLKLFPALQRIQLPMPKILAHKVHDATSMAHRPFAPFLLGAGTFFLPCGFTQALQLYVLSKGDATTGALTMLAFSLGTLPALVSLGALSSFVKGAFQRYFLKFSGALVVVLGIFSVNNGLTLAGSPITVSSMFQTPAWTVQGTEDPNAKLIGGKQIVDMTVEGLRYAPHRFTVTQGIPVEWRIDARRAVGCAQVITVPKLGITEYLSPQEVTTIRFTPQEAGTIPFSCTMGMTTRGSAFTVVPNTTGTVVAATGAKPTAELPSGGITPACDPSTANCVPAQRLAMEVSRERGFYPRTFTVKKGVPVELTVDNQVGNLGGCMSVMTIPRYRVAKQLLLGKTKLAFTPTETGTVPLTCSMGIEMARVTVTE